MTKRRAIGLLALGTVFFVCGAIGARIFYKFPMGFFEVTFWDDVLAFSALGIAGLALAAYAISGLRKSR